LKAAKEAVRSVIPQKGVRVLIFESPCIAVSKTGAKVQIDSSKCTGCKVCIQKFGCPAISLENGKAFINNALCTGCGVCAELCALGAINCGASEK
jgi:indolepyruvate ferredoxin oxidoreductase alpha subunit